jgi:hypothetical protein
MSQPKAPGLTSPSLLCMLPRHLIDIMAPGKNHSRRGISLTLGREAWLREVGPLVPPTTRAAKAR